jgi:hypothetical protein
LAGGACGTAIVDVAFPLQRRVRRRSTYAGLVYDLAPWDDTAMETVLRVRSDFPTMPIFLVVPSGERAAVLLARCAALPCVHGVLHGPGVVPRVRDGLQVLLANTPASVVGHVLLALFPELPERIAEYATCVIEGLEADRDAVRVGELLPTLALTPRVAERTFSQAGLPTPKRLADWLTLMLIAMTAERGQTTLADAARHLGYNSNDFYRLRHRVLPPGLQGIETHATQALDLTLLAFAEACGISRERAVSALAPPGLRTARRA